MGGINPALGGLAPQEWVKGEGAGVLCRLGAEKCTGWELQQGVLPGPHLSSTSTVFGNAQEVQEGCKGVSCLQALDSQCQWELAVLQRWLCKETSLPPSLLLSFTPWQP